MQSFWNRCIPEFQQILTARRIVPEQVSIFGPRYSGKPRIGTFFLSHFVVETQQKQGKNIIPFVVYRSHLINSIFTAGKNILTNT